MTSSESLILPSGCRVSDVTYQHGGFDVGNVLSGNEEQDEEGGILRVIESTHLRYTSQVSLASWQHPTSHYPSLPILHQRTQYRTGVPTKFRHEVADDKTRLAEDVGILRSAPAGSGNSQVLVALSLSWH